jgi:DNA-directed RNA polymerase subunit H (RpoH/RPB5)
MKEEDVKLFLKEKGITKKGLPVLKSTDPVVPLINVKSGDIVKITRNAVFGGTYYYYRVVE